MSRSILICLALSAMPFTAACNENSGAEAQQRANQAQSEADKAANKANAEADKKAREAQAEADKKIAGAEADFTKDRENYRHKMQSDLDAMDKKIANLEAKAKTATGKTKADLDAHLPDIKKQRDAFTNDFKSVETATATNWDATKTKLDKEYAALKDAVDKAP